MEKYIKFPLKAKKNTYATGSGKMTSSRPSSYDYHYQNGDLRYIDTYLGTHLFSGEEAIWEEGKQLYRARFE
ncbi:hypothetical protein Hs30E_17250 [Lactococcus hodotermopsidis]|uniref:Uncharacterized protein n=1 Tax=Pseudolactococcus hodotermopsidis TaxID=2709157 RepID=A0A6A0BFE2_9LACT|nr:hypothetical protein [Lactococcus hodotermopsidis]GFH43174.1 hypothetical protein Hs30E_17250 [Lactococcus hodotermopsidis]